MEWNKIASTLELIERRLGNLESQLVRMEEKFDLSLAIQRNHLIRIKNGEELPDELLLQGRPYNDLGPEKAFKIYQNKELDFLVIDVSASDYRPARELPEAIKIPLEELMARYSEIESKTIPILVFSEDGVRSILACEILIKKGYFNVNNVSGGYKFWPGLRLRDVSQS